MAKHSALANVPQLATSSFTGLEVSGLTKAAGCSREHVHGARDHEAKERK